MPGKMVSVSYGAIQSIVVWLSFVMTSIWLTVAQSKPDNPFIAFASGNGLKTDFKICFFVWVKVLWFNTGRIQM